MVKGGSFKRGESNLTSAGKGFTFEKRGRGSGRGYITGEISCVYGGGEKPDLVNRIEDAVDGVPNGLERKYVRKGTTSNFFKKVEKTKSNRDQGGGGFTIGAGL